LEVRYTKGFVLRVTRGVVILFGFTVIFQLVFSAFCVIGGIG
jgi:hypothetical protein